MSGFEASAPAGGGPISPTPPAAAEHEHVSTLHGVARRDEYAWLRAENWQEVLQDPTRLPEDIRTHLEAENAYAEAVLAPTRALRAELVTELRARIKEDDWSVPLPDGPYAYYRRFETGHQYPVYCRQARASGAGEEVLLDVNRLAEGRDYCRVIAARHSPDHSMLAFAVDLNGSERYEIRFRDLASGEELADRLVETSGSFTWAADSRTLFYVVLDESHRSRWVRRHALGAADDPTVYEEPDPGFFVRVGKTESGAFVVVDTHDHTTSEAHVLPADDPRGELRVLEPRVRDVQYAVTHHGDRFFLLVREGDGKDGRICTAPVERPSRGQWAELVPCEPGRQILDLLMFGRHLVRHELVDALPRLVVRDLETGEEHEVAFEEAAYDLGLSPGYEFETSTVRFTYSSMTTPLRVFDYDLVTRERVLLKEQEIPSGHYPSHYETRRIFAAARDGESVPVTLLYRKETPWPAPVLLYGYGSYGISMPASFSPNRLSLVDRGIVYAIAHVRGGREKGYGWYEAAKQATKRRTFEDFVDVARTLAGDGWTEEGRIAACGGSAGGMLMGAIANSDPGLFAAVVAVVPFVDVLTTMSDPTLPLTPPEWPEWGNPIESRKDYETIAAYSPYDNVRDQVYPAILAVAGLTDPRVTYWEPAKWVARLRKHQRAVAPVLLHMNMGAGHGGASGRFDHLEEIALEYAFVIDRLGAAGRA